MKIFQLSLFFSIIFFLGYINVSAQDTAAIKIAVLPLSSNGIDTISVQTVQSILELALAKQVKANVISSGQLKESTTAVECMDSKCAEEIGKKVGADRVLGCKLSVLGNKIVVQYFVVDVNSGKDLLLDQVTALNVEDLQPVMERIAMSAVKLSSISDNAEVGKIYQGESEESLRRSSRKNIGISFGYLYPQNGYDNVDKSFIVDLHLDYELEEYAVGMLLAVRKGFAMNIYGDYLFSKKDICPYIGGAFGFHWISHSDPNYYNYGNSIQQNDKSTDGFELSLNTGLRILHTYNFQIVVELGYTFSFNDYNDQAIVFTIGIL